MKSITCAVSLLFLFSCHTEQSKEYLSNISQLPSFKMLLMDSATIIQAEQIPPGKSIIMLYFRPDCIHCQAETKLLVDNINALKNVQIYFLAGAPFGEIKNYYKYYHLDQYKNIVMGKDYEHSFARIFQPSSIPYTAIYDSQKKLVKLYYGEIGIDNLVAATRD